MSRKPKRDPHLAIAYVRVSTSEQDVGAQAQIEVIERWCTAHAIELACKPFVDLGVSGALPLEHRPALLDAVNALKEHRAEILVAHKRDRLARDSSVAGHLHWLLRRDGHRICTTENAPHVTEDMAPMVRAMEGMQDIFAEFERAMIRARTKAALGVKKRRGERVGTIPYGYKLARDGVRLLQDTDEQKIVRLVKKLRGQGVSLRGIAAQLDTAGLRPRSAKRWYARTIKSIAEWEPPRSEDE